MLFQETGDVPNRKQKPVIVLQVSWQAPKWEFENSFNLLSVFAEKNLKTCCWRVLYISEYPASIEFESGVRMHLDQRENFIVHNNSTRLEPDTKEYGKMPRKELAVLFFLEGRVCVGRRPKPDHGEL